MPAYIEQLYTACLAEAAYYIESAGEAVIIDPLRETEPYLALAARRGARIKYIFETHFHADFISGHIDLARLTGAEIVYGPGAKPDYAAHIGQDGERFVLGMVSLELLHTPGHTLESACFLLYNEAGEPEAIFTGDTLFVGDVGRPDLAVKSDLTQEDLASLMYDSIHTKLLPLPDHLVVYPGHGAGSACGKNIGKETFTTMGIQKKLNYALQPMSREAFISVLIEGQTPPPAYFFRSAGINRGGYTPFDEVMKQNLQPLTPTDVMGALGSGAVLLDTRDPDAFEQGYIPYGVNIGLGGQFGIWVGTLIAADKPLVLVTEPGREAESVMRLARVGYENVVGVLEGGMASWREQEMPIWHMPSITPQSFAEAAKDNKNVILDVRKPGEWEAGIVAGAQLLELSELGERLGELDPETSYLVHCAGGYRSMIAASLLRSWGFHAVTNVKGGYNQIKTTGIPLAEPVKA